MDKAISGNCSFISKNWEYLNKKEIETLMKLAGNVYLRRQRKGK